MKQLDLNLIRVFLVLLETQNTRIAGNKLALSQPAVSKALGRLREYFDDELFTRVHSGLKPTPRALELGERLPMIMESLDDVILETPSFDPAEYQGNITIAINGFISNWLGARLCLGLIQEAPNAQVNIVNWGSQTLKKNCWMARYKQLSTFLQSTRISSLPIRLSVRMTLSGWLKPAIH